ncbi:ATP-binding protein [Pontimicrobium aquaticum]|uniref:histidine kinase n=1 Tax=Pontimicrobium aquaticum TaxID=2565367 RepID=A0A4V5LQK2_9FLAO|nr:ATP-binding protein [Pontimicrobium aquaticum]TJY34669.1 response regulator [Pontimicrobium aquaticum]
MPNNLTYKTNKLSPILKSIFQDSSDAVIGLNKNEEIVYINDAFNEVYGYQLEEVLGKHISRMLVKHVDVNFNKTKSTYFKSLLQPNTLTECVIKSKDGRIVETESSHDIVYDQSGDVLGYFCLLRNISKRKQLESINNFMLNIVNIFQTEVSVKDIPNLIKEELGQVFDAKHFFVAFLDKERDTLDLSNNTNNQNNEGLLYTIQKSLARIVFSKGEVEIFSEEDLYHEGLINFVEESQRSWFGIPLKFYGKIIGAFVIQNDYDENVKSKHDLEFLKVISNQLSFSFEQNRLHEELREALKKAKESDMLKTAFLANISHEIRTPMNQINAIYNVLINKGASKVKQVKQIDVLNKSCKRLLTTIENIVTISTIECEQIKTNFSAFKINDLLKELHNDFSFELNNEKTKILLKCNVLKEDVVINSDREKLLKVFQNLLSNAIKFTQKGSIEFGCNIKGFELEFYVKDTGVGIPKHKQNVIFERFKQAHGGGENIYDGTGLGLTIAKRFIETLGGDIEVKSEFGLGSTFCFKIPYMSSESINTSIVLEKTDNKRSKKSKLKILIVEDDKIWQRILRKFLTKISSEIILADNGIQAIKLCEKNHDIDLVLMDVGLPLLDGYSATKEIRKFNKEVIIIAQTAFCFSGDKLKAKESGCNDYIPKPIKQDILFHLISKYYIKVKDTLL